MAEENLQPPPYKCSLEKTKNDHLNNNLMPGTPPPIYDGQDPNKPLIDILSDGQITTKFKLLLNQISGKDTYADVEYATKELKRSFDYLEERGFKIMIGDEDGFKVERVSDQS